MSIQLLTQGLKKAAGGVTVTDDFNRTDASTLGANWTDYDDAWEIESNQASQPSSSTTTTSVYTGETFSADQYAQFVTDGNGGVGPVVRMTNSDNRYYAWFDGAGNVSISKRVGGSNSDITTGSHTLANGEVLRLEVSGTNLTLKVDDSTILTGSDSDLTSGDPGMVCWWSVSQVYVDDFEAGDL